MVTKSKLTSRALGPGPWAPGPWLQASGPGLWAPALGLGIWGPGQGPGPRSLGPRRRAPGSGCHDLGPDPDLGWTLGPGAMTMTNFVTLLGWICTLMSYSYIHMRYIQTCHKLS